MASDVADPRWLLLRKAVASAVADLEAAVEIHTGALRRPELTPHERRVQEKAFQKFLQDGYSSLEKALVRVLELFDEPVPAGRTWHADLVALASMPLPAGIAAARPRFAPELHEDFDTLRRTRHVVMHGYERFSSAQAAEAVAAAHRVAARLARDAEEFARAAGLLPPAA